MKKDNNPMERFAKLIIDKRKAVYIFFGLALFLCVISIPKVKVNTDITSYLPKDTETRRGLDIMEEEFTTYDTAQVMLTNTTAEYAEQAA